MKTRATVTCMANHKFSGRQPTGFTIDVVRQQIDEPTVSVSSTGVLSNPRRWEIRDAFERWLSISNLTIDWNENVPA